MAVEVQLTPNNERELVLARLMNASAEALYRAWTDPEVLPKWFAPRPLTTEVLEMDVRVGGTNRFVMRDGEGAEYPAGGVYLELVPGRKLVFTDTYSAGWVPNPDPFMTAVITFEPQPDGKTLYTARVGHPSIEKMQQHEQMGFHGGWGLCAEQLEEVAQRL